MISFNDRLAFGKMAESQIATWLRRKGWNVLPVYEKLIDEGKGPQLFTPARELIAPDLFCFSSHKHKALWIEAKHKSVFSWHRLSNQWVTGVDRRHYRDYLEVASLSLWPVWLLFLHTQDRTGVRDEPWPCPTGLYGNTIAKLQNSINHEHAAHGKSGMVYWSVRSLREIATLQEVIEAIDHH